MFNNELKLVENNEPLDKFTEEIINLLIVLKIIDQL
jgi:hypothetical protein